MHDLLIVPASGVHQARLPRHTLPFTLILHFVRFRPFFDKSGG